MRDEHLPSGTPRPSGGWREGLLIGLVVLSCIGAVLAGRSVLAERAAGADTPAPARLMSVVTQRFERVDGYRVQRRFTGQIQPLQEVGVSFEAAGTLSRVLVDEGDHIEQGQLLATLDTRLLEAEQRGLQASKRATAARVELARRTAERQDLLEQRGFVSSQGIDESSLALAEGQAQLAEIEAALAGVEVRLEKTRIRSPFAGSVASRHLDVGSVAGARQPVVSILEQLTAQFRVGVAPAMIEPINTATELTVEIGGQSHSVALHAVLPGLDAATRTRTVLLDFAAGELPPFGDTGDLIIDHQQRTAGAWLPVAALLNGKRGLWQVLVVEPAAADGSAEVGIEAVQVMHADTDRVFVQGTFRHAQRYIADGAHRVVPGQRVRFDEESG